MRTFEMAQNAGIAFRVRFFQSDFASAYYVLGQVFTSGYPNHLDGFFFETCGYFIQACFSFKLAIPELILTSTNWNVGVSLQYLHPYLPLQTGILGHDCNTCTCTYFYQLGFWGLVTIPASNTNIIIILVFLHFTLFVLITWKQ